MPVQLVRAFPFFPSDQARAAVHRPAGHRARHASCCAADVAKRRSTPWCARAQTPSSPCAASSAAAPCLLLTAGVPQAAGLWVGRQDGHAGRAQGARAVPAAQRQPGVRAHARAAHHGAALPPAHTRPCPPPLYTTCERAHSLPRTAFASVPLSLPAACASSSLRVPPPPTHQLQSKQDLPCRPRVCTECCGAQVDVCLVDRAWLVPNTATLRDKFDYRSTNTWVDAELVMHATPGQGRPRGALLAAT